MKQSYERNKNKWYLCTRPKKLLVRNNEDRRKIKERNKRRKEVEHYSERGRTPISIWELERAAKVPMLIAMDGIHVDNLIDKGKGVYYIEYGTLKYTYSGIIVVKDLECSTYREARKKIDGNRDEYIKLCNDAIEDFLWENWQYI